MSHFISRTSVLQSNPVLHNLNKHIGEPSLSQLSCSIEHPAQKSMVKMMFFHYKNAEYEQLHRENSIHMQKQFEELKRKLALKAKRQTLEKRIEGKEEGKKLRLDQIIKQHPEKVDLVKKYRGKIKEKLQLYRETAEITKSKESYHEWYDQNINSPLKSPSYSKMAYLLEKISREGSQDKQNKQTTEKRGHQRQSHKSNNNAIVQIPRMRQYRYSSPKLSKTEFSLLY